MTINYTFCWPIYSTSNFPHNSNLKMLFSWRFLIFQVNFITMNFWSQIFFPSSSYILFSLYNQRQHWVHISRILKVYFMLYVMAIFKFLKLENHFNLYKWMNTWKQNHLNYRLLISPNGMLAWGTLFVLVN